MRHLGLPSSLVGLIALGTIAACGGEPTSALSRAPSSSPLAAKPSQLPTVSLTVTVADVDGSGNPYGIRSDGGGVYTDGSQNVQAVLDQYGTFAFNATIPRHGSTRGVVYDFNNPVDPTNSYRPSPSAEGFHFSSGGSAFSPFVALQNLGINGNPSTECMYIGIGISNAITAWRVSFHKGAEDTPTSPTAFAVVTRTSVSPAVWTIEPVGSCSLNSNVASLRSDDSSVLYGYYYLPFRMTLAAR